MKFVIDNCPYILFSLLQGLWYGIRCLSTLSDIGCRRQQNTWSAVCCVVRGASLCLEERLSWMTTSWGNTRQLRRKPGTTCSTTKVRAHVRNVTKRIPSCKTCDVTVTIFTKRFVEMQTENILPGREFVRSAKPTKGIFPLLLFGDRILDFESHSTTYVCPGSGIATDLSPIQRKSEGKAIPWGACTGPEGFRRMRFWDFKKIGTWRS